MGYEAQGAHNDLEYTKSLEDGLNDSIKIQTQVLASFGAEIEHTKDVLNDLQTATKNLITVMAKALGIDVGSSKDSQGLATGGYTNTNAGNYTPSGTPLTLSSTGKRNVDPANAATALWKINGVLDKGFNNLSIGGKAYRLADALQTAFPTIPKEDFGGVKVPGYGYMTYHDLFNDPDKDDGSVSSKSHWLSRESSSTWRDKEQAYEVALLKSVEENFK